MRTAFIEALSKRAAVDSRVTLITGDLGFGVVQEFAQQFPSQFVNAGVAEQNMTGLAAGMAMMSLAASRAPGGRSNRVRTLARSSAMRDSGKPAGMRS